MMAADILKYMYTPLPVIEVKCNTPEARTYINIIKAHRSDIHVMYHRKCPYNMRTEYTDSIKLNDFTHVLLISKFTLKWFYEKLPYTDYFLIH